jgi:hypothetical protein
MRASGHNIVDETHWPLLVLVLINGFLSSERCIFTCARKSSSDASFASGQNEMRVIGRRDFTCSFLTSGVLL